MEIGQHSNASETASALPAISPSPDSLAAGYAPLHTQTQSTLAPTAEFTRIFLLAWIIRYVFRGSAGALFNEFEGKLVGNNKVARGLRDTIVNAVSKPGRALQQKFFSSVEVKELEDAAYATAVGLGSGFLSWRYSNMVKSDIQNIFSEAVSYETGKPAGQMTFEDIKASHNAIVQRTVANHHKKSFARLGTDGLFLGAAALRSGHATDLLLGVKGLQIFSDTWKRKTTMFEDLISFINNKINPRNGLGQSITVGEVFDLYQHYAENFHPDRMFTNVLERGTGEVARWAQSQPIFERMTQLMNLTYAYKHKSVIDQDTGHAVRQADFALPKLIYLMGHDLIDVRKPEQTLATIEIANRYGIPAVKEMQKMLHEGADLAAVTTRFPTPDIKPVKAKKDVEEKNTVIAKGSTMQLDQAAAPATKIDVGTIRDAGALMPAQLAAAVG